MEFDRKRYQESRELRRQIRAGLALMERHEAAGEIDAAANIAADLIAKSQELAKHLAEPEPTQTLCPSCGKQIVVIDRPYGWTGMVVDRGHPPDPQTGQPVRRPNPDRSGRILHTDGSTCYLTNVDDLLHGACTARFDTMPVLHLLDMPDADQEDGTSRHAKQMVPNEPGWWWLDGVPHDMAVLVGSGDYHDKNGRVLTGGPMLYQSLSNLVPREVKDDQRWKGRCYTQADLDAAVATAIKERDEARRVALGLAVSWEREEVPARGDLEAAMAYAEEPEG